VGLESLSECAVRGSDEFPGLIAPWQAGESEGEATQAVVQLCRCRSESRFQTEGPLVSGPEGSQGESRLLVHQPLDVSLTADGALGPVALPPEFRSEQSGSLDTSCLNPPAALWREADLPRESPEPVLRIPNLLHPDIVVVLQGQLGIEPDPQPSGSLRVEVDRTSFNLDASGAAAGVLRSLRLLRRIASVFSVSKVTALAAAHS